MPSVLRYRRPSVNSVSDCRITWRYRPGVFHVLRLVDSYCNLDLETFVRTTFRDLHLVPLGRLGTHRSWRYYNLRAHTDLQPTGLRRSTQTCDVKVQLNTRYAHDTLTRNRRKKPVLENRYRFDVSDMQFGTNVSDRGLSVSGNE